MVKNICNVWKTNKKELLVMLIVLSAGGISGMITSQIAIRVDAQMPFMALGAVIALFMWGLINFILGLFGYQNTFDLMVSMGCRRKDYILSQTISVYINMLLEFGMIGLIYMAERLVHRLVYTTYEIEDFTAYILNPKMLVMLFLLIPATRLLMGALILKYKKKAFWIIWAIWMFGSYGSGRIIHYLVEHPQNWVMVCITALRNTSVGTQLVLTLLLTVGMLIGTYLLTRKQAVYV